LRCGHIAQRDWRTVGDAPGFERFLEGRGDSPPICPGYALYLPKALEVAEAYNFLQSSEIDTIWPKPLTAMQRQYLRSYARASALADEWRRRTAIEGA
jgi:hypothetical protein